MPTIAFRTRSLARRAGAALARLLAGAVPPSDRREAMPELFKFPMF